MEVNSRRYPPPYFAEALAWSTAVSSVHDKSTWQSYNLKENFFGYRGVPTSRTQLLLEELSDKHGVFTIVVVQATNGCDALLHSAQKRKLRNYPAPLCTDHIVRDWKRACDEICYARTIQRCFMRALRRNTEGNIDESWWWTRHRFRKWVWLWVELEKFPFKTFWKTFNFCILHVLKGFLPFFCQDLPVIWVNWSGRFEIQLCQVNRNR